MKKIALIHDGTDSNQRDRFLYEAAQYLLRQCESDLELIEVNIHAQGIRFYRHLSLCKSVDRLYFAASKCLYVMAVCLLAILRRIPLSAPMGFFRYFCEYQLRWFRSNYMIRWKLAGVDGIVVSGAGFTDWKGENLVYYLSQVIAIAEKHHIPVLINATTIPACNVRDYRCKKLKADLNKSCVKIILCSHRLDLLQNSYITNKNVQTALTGDWALWAPECYGLKREEPLVHNVVAIEVMHKRDFGRGVHSFSHLQLVNFYKSLIKALDARGQRWVLLCPKGKAGREMAVKILKSLDQNVNKKIAPVPRDRADFLDMLRRFKMLFAVEPEVCQIAWALNVPIAGLLWKKMRNFVDLISKGENFITGKQLSADLALEAIDQSVHCAWDVRIREHLCKLTLVQMEQFCRLLEKEEETC